MTCMVFGSKGLVVIFFFNDTATTEIYTLSLHDALPISRSQAPESRTGPHGRQPGSRPPALQRRVRRAARQKNGRAHGWNPVTGKNRMPASSLKKKKKPSS